MRTGIKISPIGLILLCSMVAIGMLTGLLYQMFTVTIEGDVELTGQMKPLFSFDGVDFETPYLNMSADLTELNSSETKTFNHYIINKDAGGWLVDVNLTACQFFYNDPPHQFYGLNVTVENVRLNGVPVTEMSLAPLDNLSFDLVWSLHHEFVTAIDPFPSLITITLTRTNMAPVAVDDTAYTTVPKMVDVLVNDYDPDVSPDDLTITDVTPLSAPHITISIVDNQLYVVPDGSWTGSQVFTYTISDGDKTDTATLTVIYG
jgi:hypothetical protein